jgi:hypothetical protein
MSALSLVSGKFSNEKVVWDTSSPDSTARIQVVFDKGRFVSAGPASAVVLLDGG